MTYECYVFINELHHGFDYGELPPILTKEQFDEYGFKHSDDEKANFIDVLISTPAQPVQPVRTLKSHHHKVNEHFKQTEVFMNLRVVASQLRHFSVINVVPPVVTHEFIDQFADGELIIRSGIECSVYKVDGGYQIKYRLNLAIEPTT